MKKMSLAFLMALVLAMSASIAFARDAGIYLSGNVGVVWVEDADVTWFDGLRDQFEFDAGLGTTIAVGYDFGYGLRTEFELGFRFNDLDRKFPGGIKGDIYSSSFMANVFFDLIPGQRFSPFIGAGAGLAYVDFDIDYWGQDDDTVFAYQFMAGVSYALNYNVSIDFQYRYFATEDPSFYFFEAEYKTHGLMGGFRFRF